MDLGEKEKREWTRDEEVEREEEETITVSRTMS